MPKAPSEKPKGMIDKLLKQAEAKFNKEQGIVTPVSPTPKDPNDKPQSRKFGDVELQEFEDGTSRWKTIRKTWRKTPNKPKLV